MKRPLTPQDKKALSLSKDRRNDYGENDKASRKAIPLRKAQANRRLRRTDKQALSDAEVAAADVPLRRPKPDWKKSPDATLGDILSRQLAIRAELNTAPVRNLRGRARLNNNHASDLLAGDTAARQPTDPKRPEK